MSFRIVVVAFYKSFMYVFMTMYAGDDVRLFDRHYRRAYVKSVNGSHFAREKAAKNAIFGRAKARRVGTCDAVDNMAGCIDHKNCEVVDTAFCRCKNSCDSIPPADLDFDGFSGVQGDIS
jgi:hypothetical protein